MRLYLKECKKIATSIIYYLFVALLVVSWYQNFFGVTKEEIDWANGGTAPDYTFDRPLLAEPTTQDDSYGNKAVEDPEKIMTGATDALLSEYEGNSYAAYPLGYYKAVSLNDLQQARVLKILCEITGLTPEQLENLPDGYFPAANGTIIHFNSADTEQSGNGFSITMSDDTDQPDKNDYTKTFIPQVSYDRFKELMAEMVTMIGENGSKYSMDMMISYYGLTEMTYDDAMADYQQTVEKDEVTGGFARLFCDYMGQVLGLYPIFLIAAIWLKDKRSKMDELIYSRKVSSSKLVTVRYLASVTMLLLPVILLSFESLIPLIGFTVDKGLSVDCFAFIKYILWWILPTVMIVTVIGTLLTLLTDAPIAILLQFAWWLVDRGTTGLTGDTGLFTLMIRHNTLRGYEITQQSFGIIWVNRICLTVVSIVLIACSIWTLDKKRKGKINAAATYEKCFSAVKSKLGLVHKA